MTTSDQRQNPRHTEDRPDPLLVLADVERMFEVGLGNPLRLDTSDFDVVVHLHALEAAAEGTSTADLLAALPEFVRGCITDAIGDAEAIDVRDEISKPT